MLGWWKLACIGFEDDFLLKIVNVFVLLRYNFPFEKEHDPLI